MGNPNVRNTHKPDGSVREKVGKGRRKWMGKKEKLRIKRVKRRKADLHMYSSAEVKVYNFAGERTIPGLPNKAPC